VVATERMSVDEERRSTREFVGSGTSRGTIRARAAATSTSTSMTVQMAVARLAGVWLGFHSPYKASTRPRLSNFWSSRAVSYGAW
jgi:hypothetical protein